MIKLNDTYLKKFITLEEYNNSYNKALESLEVLESKKGLGNDFLGWLDLPINYDKIEFDRMIKLAEKINKDGDVLLVIGIGGSYLGAKAGLEMLDNYFSKKGIEVIFVGNQLSSTYITELLEYLDNKSVYVNVISKSGTTLEPAIAFRFIKQYMEKRYGDEASKRIIATTDKEKGALKNLANKMNYETFIVPDNIGGRYSVLTPVGLLVLAIKGYDINKIMEGAKKAYYDTLDKNSDCLKYACYRNILYKKGYKIEMLVNYEPCLLYFQEWWKQLYGESEGKDHLGIFPASASFSTDLHSLGQYIQDGERIIFETVLNIISPKLNVNVPYDSINLDGLNFLDEKNVDFVNKMALKGTTIAHVEGGVPNIILDIENINEYSFGYMVYFFMKACGISAYMLGVNPFNQPGVEDYKKNMFALLGKPGYEDILKKLIK